MKLFSVCRVTYIIIFFFLASCVKEDRKPYYRNFDFGLLKPTSNCADSLKVNVTYNKEGVSSLVFSMNDQFLKRDTAIYSNDDMFLFSESSYCQAVRISARVADTSRIFVFKKIKSHYKLSLIESYLTDSSFKVEYVWKSTIQPVDFTKSTLDSLKHNNRYVIPYIEFSVFEYHYNSDSVLYNRIEHFVEWTQNAHLYEKEPV